MKDQDLCRNLIANPCWYGIAILYDDDDDDEHKTDFFNPNNILMSFWPPGREKWCLMLVATSVSIWRDMFFFNVTKVITNCISRGNVFFRNLEPVARRTWSVGDGAKDNPLLALVHVQLGYTWPVVVSTCCITLVVETLFQIWLSVMACKRQELTNQNHSWPRPHSTSVSWYPQ